MYRASLVLLFLSLATATAQPPTPAPTPTPLIVYMLINIDDENCGKELQLKPEQVKKFVEFRQKQWDEQYTTAPAEYRKGQAERDKATVAIFKDTLTADQYKRAEELARQRAWASGFTGSRALTDTPTLDTTRVTAITLFNHPELATALNLSDEQKKLVTARASGPGRNAPVVYLTTEQAKVAADLLGKPRKTFWKNATDSRVNAFGGGQGGGVFGGAALWEIQLTEAKDVRTEIGLTEEQVKALAPVLAKSQSAGNSYDTNVSPEAAAKATLKASEELQAEAGKALAVLKPEQLARLRQIVRQTQGGGRGGFGRRGGFGGPVAPTTLSDHLGNAAFRKMVLGFTAEQDKALTDADKVHADGVEKAALADGPVDAAIKAIDAVRETREKAYAAVLTAAQKKKLDELLGKPFTGSTFGDGNGVGTGPGSFPVFIKTMRVASFGKRIVFELRLAALNKDIQADLGLKPDQVKKLEEKAAEANKKFGSGSNLILAAGSPDVMEKSMAEQSEFVTKALTEVLTAEQLKRMSQLLIQRAEFLVSRSRGISSSTGVAGVPGVAEAIKLTAEQKSKLIESTTPDDILTADQKKIVKDMAGKKYDGTFTVSFPGAAFPGRTTLPTTYAVLAGVPHSVFKITPEQSDKLAVALNQYQLETQLEPRTPGGGGNPGGGFPGGFPGTQVNPAKMTAANEKLTTAVTAILTAEQVNRIEQVKYQALAAGPGALTVLRDADISKSLKLTKEQTDKIAGIIIDFQRRQSAAIGPNGFGFNGVNLLSKVSDKSGEKAMAVLTAEQKAKWKAMTGEPVPNLPTNLAAPGGFGGGGVFPGGGFGGGFPGGGGS